MFKLLLVLFLLPTIVLATTGPFHPYEKKKFDEVDATAAVNTAITTKINDMTAAYTAEGINVKRIARITYDTATDGGGIGAHALGVTLPAKSLITEAYMYTDTQFVDAGSGTVAISCEDANNIYTATDITGNAAGTIVQGTASYDAKVNSIANACEVTATVSTATQTSGKLTIFVEYVVTD